MHEARTSYSWVGGDGDWNTAAMWMPNGIPGDGDTALFATGGNFYTVTGDASVAGITVNGDSVTFDGQLFQTSGVSTAFLTADSAATVTLDQNAFVIGAGINFAQGSVLEVNGTLVDTGGTADVALVDGATADWTNGAGVLLNQLYVQDGGTYAGDVTLRDGGSITLDASGSLSGGTITLAGQGTIYAADAPGGTGGSFTMTEDIVTGASGDAVILASDPDLTFVLSGDISGAGFVAVNGGTVELAGVNTYTGGTLVDGTGIAASLILAGGDAAGTGAVYLNDGLLTTIADSTGSSSFGATIVGAAGSDTVIATSGALSVLAGQASVFTFTGGDGHSSVLGGSGQLIATSGIAGDLIFGGTSGTDVLNTGGASAILAGGVGGTLVATGGGTSLLAAGSGNSTLQGGGSTGAVYYFGSNSGDTTIQTGSGLSEVIGNGGADTVYGGTGTDYAIAGTGAEQYAFVAGNGGGTTALFNFNTATDHLSLQGYGANEAQNAIANALVAYGSTELTLSDNTHIIFYGETGLTTSIFT